MRDSGALGNPHLTADAGMPIGLAYLILAVAAVVAALLYLRERRRPRPLVSGQDGIAVGNPSDLAAASKRSS